MQEPYQKCFACHCTQLQVLQPVIGSLTVPFLGRIFWPPPLIVVGQSSLMNLLSRDGICEGTIYKRCTQRPGICGSHSNALNGLFLAPDAQLCSKLPGKLKRKALAY